MLHRAQICLAALLLLDCTAHSQPLPSFDVASVRIAPGDVLMVTPNRSTGRITWTTDFWYLIGYAYRLSPARISGPVPGDHIYTITATMSPDATDDQVRLMLQSLLKERFRMVAHGAAKQADGYSLLVAKGGPKIRQAAPNDTQGVDGRVIARVTEPGVVLITGRNVSMFDFCQNLERHLNAPVVDETALPAKYTFEFRYAQQDAPPEVVYPPLPIAIQELGLKLERHKVTVDTLVVDSIATTPADN